MEETKIRASTIAVSSSSPLSSKCLLFDRRYGWVFDDWTDPAEEALAGGRGMFCILSLAKACLKTASTSINLATSSAAKYIERPDRLNPQLLKASIEDQLHRFTSFLQKPEFNFSTGKVDSPSDSSSDTSPQDMENREQQVA